MKTRFFTTAIALMALTFVFNSCEKEDSFLFPNDQVELLLPDGVVVDTTIRKKDIVSSTNPDYTVVVMVGTEKDNLSTFMGNDKCVLKIDQKYYWQAKVVDSKSGENSEFSEIRSFYVLDPKMKVTMETDNGETESAIVLRWSDIDHNKYKNIKVQMKPTKECGFAGKTFEITNGQDSLYIRLADNPEIPYMFNDFDDLNGINYEPVIYEFSFVSEVVVGDKEFQTRSGSVKEIFLNKKNHIRDHECNVYRVVEVGDQVWMADDLRCTSYIDENGDTIQMKLNEDYVVSELPSGAKGILYNTKKIHPSYGEEITLISEFYIPNVHSWQNLLVNFGVKDAIKEDGEYYPSYTIPELSGDMKKSDSIANIAYLKSNIINLWRDVFASASDWVDSFGKSIYPDKSMFNVKPFGFYISIGQEYCLNGQGISSVYYAECADMPTYLISFCYGKEGVGLYPTHWYDYHINNYFFTTRLVKTTLKNIFE